MTKAYATLQIKSVADTDDARIIKGIASTPSTDRDDDILEPEGAKFALPIPLLWQHNHNQPIGEVIEACLTEKGIEITAKIANIYEKGKLKERVDEAWHSIKSGLVKCLSVGFRIKEYDYIENSWGLHIKQWEWYELSVVTIAANADAVITSVKQIKDAFCAPIKDHAHALRHHSAMDAKNHTPWLNVDTDAARPFAPNLATACHKDAMPIDKHHTRPQQDAFCAPTTTPPPAHPEAHAVALIFNHGVSLV